MVSKNIKKMSFKMTRTTKYIFFLFQQGSYFSTDPDLLNKKIRIRPGKKSPEPDPSPHFHTRPIPLPIFYELGYA